MKRIIVCILIMAFAASCSQSVTMQQAANRNYKGTRAIR
jgi:hypothetical protein